MEYQQTDYCNCTILSAGAQQWGMPAVYVVNRGAAWGTTVQKTFFENLL